MAGTASGFSPSALWSAWPQRRFVATPAPCLRHAELVERLFALEARYPGRLTLEEVGRSVQGRKIHLVTLGSGPRRILLWSQMHGDEPSATPALLDLADTLLASDEPEHRAILEGLTLLMVPMLNPDGAERYARRNAQAIDINRDALHLATPEGRLLKALRDRLQPELGFNLHDQNRRTTVGDTGVLSTISLLAVSGDREGTLTPGRARAKRVCSAIARTLEPFVPGGIGRYDEDWNPRAFGDNVTAWGTPVVLIESGGIPPGRPLTDLTRLNYVALAHRAPRPRAGRPAWRVPRAVREPEAQRRRQLDGRPARRRPRLAAVGGRAVPGGRGLRRPRRRPPRRLLRRARLAGRLAHSRGGRRAAARLRAPARRRGPPGGARLRRVRARARRALLADGGGARRRRGGWEWPALRWHVAPADRPAALAHAGRLAAPGRPSVEVVDADAPASFLEIAAPPGTPSSPAVESALDALTRGAWRTRAAGRTLGELLGELAGAGPDASSPVVAPDARASLLVLHPREDLALDASSVDLEAVFIDGREPGGAR